METVALATTGRRTTRLGFGCSSLMGSLSRRESLATLEAAFDAGIRHFDVAPSYGFGAAETCLGEFLNRHPGQTTVTTKYGMAVPVKQSLISVARTLARPVLQILPGAKRAALRTASRFTRPAIRPTFLPGPAGQALDRSLAALRTDHIDIWLMHEVEAADLAGAGGDELLEFLYGAVSSGKIGAFGVGSGGEKVPALVAGHPAFCAIRQYEWSVFDPRPMEDGSFRLHHRTLTDNFRTIYSVLTADPKIADRWSECVGVDLHAREKLAEVMLAAALFLNPKSVILFSSKSMMNIAANAAVAEESNRNKASGKAAETFYRLIQEQGASLTYKGLRDSSKAPRRSGQ